MGRIVVRVKLTNYVEQQLKILKLLKGRFYCLLGCRSGGFQLGSGWRC